MSNLIKLKVGRVPHRVMCRHFVSRVCRSSVEANYGDRRPQIRTIASPSPPHSRLKIALERLSPALLPPSPRDAGLMFHLRFPNSMNATDTQLKGKVLVCHCV